MGVAKCVRNWPLKLLLGINLVGSLQLIKLCAGKSASQCGRKDKVPMTIMSFKSQNSESTVAPLPHYECYLGAEDGDAVVSSYRPFRTKNGGSEPQPSSPVRLTDNSLPANTAAYSVSLDTASNNAFGVFTFNALTDARKNTTVFTIFMRSDGYIVPSDERFTKTVNVGDIGVNINMTLVDDTAIPRVSSGSQDLDIRWRINGSNSVDSIGGVGAAYQGVDYTQLSSRGIRVDDEGVYEAQGFTLRNAQHALQRLIVRFLSVKLICKGFFHMDGYRKNHKKVTQAQDCKLIQTQLMKYIAALKVKILLQLVKQVNGDHLDVLVSVITVTMEEFVMMRQGDVSVLQDSWEQTVLQTVKMLHMGQVVYRNVTVLVIKVDVIDSLECVTQEDVRMDGVEPTVREDVRMDGVEPTVRVSTAAVHGSGSSRIYGYQGRCDRFTGVCDSGRCQDGWSGTNCQTVAVEFMVIKVDVIDSLECVTQEDVRMDGMEPTVREDVRMDGVEPTVRVSTPAVHVSGSSRIYGNQGIYVIDSLECVTQEDVRMDGVEPTVREDVRMDGVEPTVRVSTAAVHGSGSSRIYGNQGICNRFTGVCDSGRCQDGWSGTNCQNSLECVTQEDVRMDGVEPAVREDVRMDGVEPTVRVSTAAVHGSGSSRIYGNQGICNRFTGVCDSGRCQDGWSGTNCQNSLECVTQEDVRMDGVEPTVREDVRMDGVEPTVRVSTAAVHVSSSSRIYGNQGICNRFTGVCDSGRCQDGWSGTNCQIPDDCPTGYFGMDCTEKCLCMNNVACDKITGECTNGQCAPGSVKPMGSVRCQECPDGFYGDSCREECHCESNACDKATGECVGCCKPQWLETDSNTCQTGLEGSSFLKVNSDQSTRVRCDTSIITTYRTELSRERDSLVDSGIIRGSTGIEVNNQGSLISNTDFTINNVSSADVFYCLLVSNTETVAWLNTTFSAYVLPVLSDPPTFHRRTTDAVTISWRAWDAEKDVGDPPVVSYVTYYKEVAVDVWVGGSDVSHDAPTLEFTASDLGMDVNYTFAVSAVRDGDGGEGPRSPPVTVKTLCGDAAVPINVQARLTDDNKVQVSWQITPGSITCSTGVTSFTVFAQIEGSSDEPIIIASVGGEMTSYIISEGLEDGVSYTFLVSSTTDQEGAQSIRSEAVLYTAPSGSFPVAFIVIIIVAIVLVLAIILMLLVFRRYYCRKEPQGKSESDRVDSAVYSNDVVSNEPIGYSSLELDSKEATSPSDYHHLHQGRHGETMSEYEETDLSKAERKVRGSEYEDVGNSQPGRYNLPKPPAEPQTNSTVQYEYHDYEEPGDFENYTGVYINIPDTHHSFSPEPIKVPEFQSFMRKDKTQLVEGIVKEFMGNTAYWLEKVKTTETYGELTVLGMELTSSGTYTVRKMKVLQNDDDKIHTVQQIQLHMWPFRGVPEDISDLIAVIKKVKALQERDTAGPLLVHCSNGSGATGTFVAIYSLMDALKESKTISVFNCVNNMRKDRMDMVQTRIQYLFIYQTLQEAQLFPENSSLSCSQLKNLSDKILNEKAQKEFKVLRKVDENSRQTKSGVGRLATNAHKNRFKGIIPLDKYRAALKSEGLTHGSSDYINASIAENDGSRYIVMAQSPLPATIEDFWRLVYDYQCRTVIMLDNANNIDKESVSVEQLVYDGLEKKQDIDVNKLAKFVSFTQTDRSKTLVVHCINGVGLSAVYVVVRSLMESIKNGDECDVFLAVQKLRMRNPHAIQTQDEYILCLQLLRSILNNQQEYAVVY
ncbi:Receptor-type tyrosine-protein phosphatase mu [Holothuria leucospilota]|uniref:Receptor-type tyrosine-protein phosphatase mu n=1 Tax=Holothuria leucospilota TaxID=206669 RepID=A0A9Q1C9L7_HOLLE|nr:Receptor-type tyrosine-protein phosphatase mu [Holothuria leucospilota]